MAVRFSEIVELLRTLGLPFRPEGDEIEVIRPAAIGGPVTHALCYSVHRDPAYLAEVRQSVVICAEDHVSDSPSENSYVFTHHPQLLFFHACRLFEAPREAGVHPSAVVHPAAVLGDDVSIGAFCRIDHCRIGDHSTIESGVTIHAGTTIGRGVMIQANTVVGAVGLMWTWDNAGGVVACPQTGAVEIGDGSILGANVTIVRGAFANRNTILGAHTMVAPGTSIGHGCVIGRNTHFGSNVSLSGSVRSGANCFFGSGAAVRPHVSLADDTIVGVGAVVVKSVAEAGTTLFGNPAKRLNLATYGGKLSGIPQKPPPSGDRGDG